MQKYGQSYGFWLIPTENTTHQEYTEIKAGIEMVCEEARKQAKLYDLQYEILGFPLRVTQKDRLYLSVCLFEGQPLFGIFDANSKIISNSCDIEAFSYFFQKDFEDFAYRNKNTLVLKSKGVQTSQLKQLHIAWSKYIFNNQSTIRKVIQANTNNNLFLEKEDTINPVMKF